MSETEIVQPVWLEDANGNKSSVTYFGTQEAAQKALDSLIGCKNCVNCSGCSRCSYCSGCSNVACGDAKNGIDAIGSGWAGPPSIPIIENIDAAIYAAASQPDALNMSDWHVCGTTHCRAGWAVHLAGEAGYALELFYDTALAAQLIYRASGSPISPCRFYDTDKDALADMAKRAGVAA